MPLPQDEVGFPISADITLDATDLAAILAQMAGGLNTAIPASNTANSANDMLLDQIPAAIAAIPTTAMRGTDSAALAAEWTAARAGYVDELAAANLPTDVANAIAAPAAALAAFLGTYPQGWEQTKRTTYDLNDVAGAGTFDLWTGTAQDVLVELLVCRNPVDVTGGATTSFSIQTDDDVAQVLVSDTDAIKAVLDVGKTFTFVGGFILKVGSKIQITVNGAASGIADSLDIAIKYSALTAGGYLA